MKLNHYVSLEEKSVIFSNRHLIINTLSDFQNWYNEITAKGQEDKMFRGVNEAKYKNYTSAQRKYITNDLAMSGVSLKGLIQMQIDKLKGIKPHNKGGVYKTLLRRYYDSLEVITTDLLFLSFAQHYGGISPLIDFTRNLNIALYFMTTNNNDSYIGGDDIENYASIYYLPVEGYRQEIPKKIDKKEIIDKLTFEKMTKQSPLVITDKNILLREHNGIKEKTVITISNFNIIMQEGGFVFYFNQDKSKELQPLEQELYCVDIHKSLVPYIKDENLKKHNISERFLFPKEDEIVKLSLEETLRDIIDIENH